MPEAKQQRRSTASSRRRSPGTPPVRKAKSTATVDRTVDRQQPDTEGRFAEQRRQFVEAYCQHFNATQAAIEAGYSKGTAKQQGSRLLTRVDVQAAIEAFRSQVTVQAAHDMGVSLERTLLELARLAYFDPRKLYGPKGEALPLHELSDDVAAAVAGLDVQELFAGSGRDREVIGVIRKWKLADKKSALDMLMKHLGGYALDNKQQTPFAEALSQFLGSLHSAGGSPLPIRQPHARPAVPLLTTGAPA